MSERFEKGRKVLKQINDDSIEDIFKGLEGIAPVLGRFIVEYPYSEIYTREAVDLKKRELCTIAALTVMGFPQGELKAHVRGNLAAGNSPEEIIEVIIQMSAYGGFPAAINAVNTTKEVFKERNLLPLKISESDTKMERKERKTRNQAGLEVLKQTKNQEEDEILSDLEEFIPAMRRFIIEFPYSEIYTREGLDLKTRELCTVAALTALGNCQDQLKVHIEAALNLENTPEEIVEIIMQMTAYSGFPSTLNGLKVAKEVFKERNLLPLNLEK